MGQESTPIVVDLTGEQSSSSELHIHVHTHSTISTSEGQSSQERRSDGMSSNPPAPSLIAALSSQLMKQRENTIALLAADTDHFQSERGEVGWACGFRNCQMLLSSVIRQKDMHDIRFGGRKGVPTVASLQSLIEDAWARGWDREGARQLGYRLSNSHIKIGTTEVAALLASMHLRPRIADFCSKFPEQHQVGHPFSGPMPHINAPGANMPNETHIGVECDNCGMHPVTGPCFVSCSRRNYDLCSGCHTHPGARSADPFQRRLGRKQVTPSGGGARGNHDNRNGSNVLKWVWDYFAEDGACAAAIHLHDATSNKNRNSVVRSSKPPLYFQHDGHSRTIIGIEFRKNVCSSERLGLLVFDPVQRSAILRHALEDGSNWAGMLRRTVHDIQEPEYQILSVLPGIALDSAEIEASKIIVNNQLITGSQY